MKDVKMMHDELVNTGAFAIHLWNQVSRDYFLESGSVLQSLLVKDDVKEQL